MLAFTSIGVKDLARARSFYDQLFAELDVSVVFERPDGNFIGYGESPGMPQFAICRPYDGGDASVGNGAMIAIAAKTPANAKALYDKAIELGATDAGEPGPRLDGAVTCAYVRDLDGNKLNFFASGS